MTMLHPKFGEVVAKVEELLNSPRLFVFGRIDAWLKAGADPELDIYPTLKRLAANGRWSGSNLSYFDRAVMQSYVDRTTPAPVMQPTPKLQGKAYLPSPTDPVTIEIMDRSRAELMMKGIRVPAATDRDARRMVSKGLLSPERARVFGFDVPEKEKAGSVEADPRPIATPPLDVNGLLTVHRVPVPNPDCDGGTLPERVFRRPDCPAQGLRDNQAI